jgi:hypothetical protein
MNNHIILHTHTQHNTTHTVEKRNNISLTVVNRDEWIINSNNVDIVLLCCRTHYQTVLMDDECQVGFIRRIKIIMKES